MTVPERAQLFQRLEALQRRRFQPVVKVQVARAVGVDANMAVAWQPRRKRALMYRKTIAGPGNRRATEIERVAGMITHHLDHVGIEQRRGVGYGMTGRGD